MTRHTRASTERDIFAVNLRRTMLDRNMSQSDLARAVWASERIDKRGYSQPVGKDRVSAYINGRVMPNDVNLKHIADVLEVPVETLIGSTAASATTPLNSTVTPQEPKIELKTVGKKHIFLSVSYTFREELLVEIMQRLAEWKDKTRALDAESTPAEIPLQLLARRDAATHSG